MIRGREALEALEESTLASYGTRSRATRGRRHPEAPPNLRTHHQRDRDRILHSDAFRRLQYKAQAFLVREGHPPRTRLTHSLEVSQIARSLAAFLGANVDLANAVALLRDLGQAPFGHQGELELNALAQAHGVAEGFEHTQFCARLVDVLERRYEAFAGLNLSWEAREGIFKHNRALEGPAPAEGGVRFDQPGVEVQIASLSDVLAYVTHDLEDALFLGFLSWEEVGGLGLPLVEESLEGAGVRGRVVPGGQRLGIVTQQLVGRLVRDALEETNRRLEQIGEAPSPDDVRRQPDAVVGLSEDVDEQVAVLIGVLTERVYRHPSVELAGDKGRRVLRALFEHFVAHPSHLPENVQGRLGSEEGGVARGVLDVLACGTDRALMALHRRVFSPSFDGLGAIL